MFCLGMFGMCCNPYSAHDTSWCLQSTIVPGKVTFSTHFVVYHNVFSTENIFECYPCVFFFFFKYLFTWLRRALVVVLGSSDLPCDMRVFSRSMQNLSCSMWDLVPDQGLNLDPCIASSVLATGPPGRSPSLCIYAHYFFSLWLSWLSSLYVKILWILKKLDQVPLKIPSLLS